MFKCSRPQIYVVNALVQALPGTHKEGIPSKTDFLYKVIQTVVYNCDRKCAQIFGDVSGQLCGKCGLAGSAGLGHPEIDEKRRKQ